ncbi:LysR family transcriptional regulator [Stenotrophomonas sp. MMGLT7]|uniref:LysR family transcriptional regulator n=1 Tax=Stenotrophomonas sp. MMGLT7 TaxID=2901227 RepID=UPI001E2836EC|nr:LysR family transcriptional regulator [Stenotrophomonas sp. MMGLT7]
MTLGRPLSHRVNLKLLQSFLVVAEHSSFREAASQMNRTQAAISAQIKLLEEQLGFALFHRTTRAVRLTANGELLLDYARQAVSALEQGLQQILGRADMKRGRVTFACSPTLVTHHLPPVLSAFKAEYPEVVLSLLELKSTQLFESLRNEDVDFAIGPVTDNAEFDFEPIWRERVYLAVHRDLVPKTRSRIPLEKLAYLPIAQFYGNTVLGRMLEEAAYGRGYKLNVRYQCIQGQTLVALSEAGLAASIMVESLLPSITSPQVQKLLITDPAIVQRFGIIKRRDQRLSSPALRLVDLILGCATPPPA